MSDNRDPGPKGQPSRCGAGPAQYLELRCQSAQDHIVQSDYPCVAFGAGITIHGSISRSMCFDISIADGLYIGPKTSGLNVAGEPRLDHSQEVVDPGSTDGARSGFARTV